MGRHSDLRRVVWLSQESHSSWSFTTRMTCLEIWHLWRLWISEGRKGASVGSTYYVPSPVFGASRLLSSLIFIIIIITINIIIGCTWGIAWVKFPNWSHSFNLPQVRQLWILNLLCQVGIEPHLQRDLSHCSQVLNPLCHSGNLSFDLYSSSRRERVQKFVEAWSH